MSYIKARKFSCSGYYRSLPTTSEHSKRSRPAHDDVKRGTTMANSEQGSAAQSDGEFRVLPYQFEPLARPENRPENQPEARAAVHNPGDCNVRLGNTNWCECGNCVTMEKAEECNCCMESHKIVEKLRKRRPKNKPDVTCVTQLRGFQSVCLDPDVLETAYFQYKEEHGAMQATLDELTREQFIRETIVPEKHNTRNGPDEFPVSTDTITTDTTVEKLDTETLHVVVIPEVRKHLYPSLSFTWD